jgi:serine/threonine protein kinase
MEGLTTMAMTANQFATNLTITPDMHPGYRLLRPRGRGAFGAVWEAETDGGERVALKFLPSTRGRGAMQELRSLQLVLDLRHPNLIRISKVWGATGCLVVAMELADGSLADLYGIYRTEVGTPLPADHLCPLLAQAAEALDFLNNRQHLLGGQWVTVQHCDVTPTNLLVFSETVKLTDFGLTTTLAAVQKGHQRAGTPDYAAPEVFLGRVSDRTDQYALAVCYCLLRGGKLPFADTPATFQPGYVRPAPDLSMLPESERPIVSRALAQAPPDRWTSCGELIARLGRAAAGLPPEGQSVWMERRQDERYRPSPGITCAVSPTLGNGAWKAEIQNVSARGLRLRVCQPQCALRPGRVLELALAGRVRSLRLTVRLRLTNATALEGGDFEVGGALDRPLRPDELELLSIANSA